MSLYEEGKKPRRREGGWGEGGEKAMPPPRPRCDRPQKVYTSARRKEKQKERKEKHTYLKLYTPSSFFRLVHSISCFFYLGFLACSVLLFSFFTPLASSSASFLSFIFTAPAKKINILHKLILLTCMQACKNRHTKKFATAHKTDARTTMRAYRCRCRIDYTITLLHTKLLHFFLG